MRATIRDIAEKAGVSTATVSNVINGKPNKASKEVAGKVIKVAEELNYLKARTKKRALKSQEKNIGLLIKRGVEGWDNSFYADILHGVSDVLNKEGCNLFYSSLRRGYRGELQLRQKMVKKEITGLLTVGVIEEQVVEDALANNIPVVSIDQESSNVSSVISDSQAGAYEAVNYLIALKHSNIAFIGGPKKETSFMHRACGYKLALLENGISVDFDKMLFMRKGEIKEGYEAVKQLIKRQKNLTAAFCCNDHLACGALKALREENMVVPRDFSLIGFDDTELAQAVAPSLTSVRVDAQSMGAIGTRKLLDEIDNPKDSIVAKTVIPVKFIKRDSCTEVKKDLT